MGTWRDPLPLLAVVSILIYTASSEILKLKSNPFGNFAIGFEKGFINSGKYAVIVPEGDMERRRTIMIRGPKVRDSVDMVFNTHTMVFSDWSGLFMLGSKVFSDTFGTLYYMRVDHKCSKKVYQDQRGEIVVVDSQTMDKEKCDAVRAKVESALHNFLEEPYKFLRPKAPPELRASPGFPGGDYVTGVLYGNFTCGQHNVELPAGDCEKERKVVISAPGVHDEIKMKVDLHSKMYGSWDGHFYLADKVFSVEPQTLVVEKDDGSCIKKFYGTEGSDIVVVHQILLKQEDCFVIKSGVFAALQKHIEPSSLSSEDKKELEHLEKKNKQLESAPKKGGVKNSGIPIQVSSTVVMPKRYQYIPVKLHSGNSMLNNIEHPVFRSLYEHHPQLANSQDDGIVNIQTNDIEDEDATSVKNIQTNDVYVPDTAIHEGVSSDGMVKPQQVMSESGYALHTKPNDLDGADDGEDDEYYYVPVDALEDSSEAEYLSPEDLQQQQGLPLSGHRDSFMGQDFQMFDKPKASKNEINNNDYLPVDSLQAEPNTLLDPQGLYSPEHELDFPKNKLGTAQQSRYASEQNFERNRSTNSRNFQSVNPGQQVMVPEGLGRVARSIRSEDESRPGQVQNIQSNHVDLDEPGDVTNLQTNDVEVEDIPKLIRVGRDAHNNGLKADGYASGFSAQIIDANSDLYSEKEVHSNTPNDLVSLAVKSSEHGKVVNIQTNDVEGGHDAHVTNIQTNKVEEEDNVEHGLFQGIDPSHESVNSDDFRITSRGTEGRGEGVINQNREKRSIHRIHVPHYLPGYKILYRPRNGQIRGSPHHQSVQNIQTNEVDVSENEEVSNIQTNDVNEHEDAVKTVEREKREIYILSSPIEEKHRRHDSGKMPTKKDNLHNREHAVDSDRGRIGQSLNFGSVQNIQTNHVDVDEDEVVRNIQTNDVNEHALGRKKRRIYLLPSKRHGKVQNIQTNHVDVDDEESVRNIQENDVNEYGLGRKKRRIYLLPSERHGKVQNIQTNHVDVNDEETVNNIQTNDVDEHGLGRKKRGIYLLPSKRHGKVQNVQTNHVEVDDEEAVTNIQTNDVFEHGLGRKKRGIYLMPSERHGKVQNVQTNHVEVDDEEAVKNIQTNDVVEHGLGRKKRGIYLLPPNKFEQVQNVQRNHVDVDEEEAVNNIQTNDVTENPLERNKRVYLTASPKEVEWARQASEGVENKQTNKVDVNGEESVSNIQTNDVNEESRMPQSVQSFRRPPPSEPVDNVNRRNEDIGESDDFRDLQNYGVNFRGDRDIRSGPLFSDSMTPDQTVGLTDASPRFVRSVRGYSQPEVLNNQVTNIDASKGLPSPGQPSEFISVQGNNMLDPADVKATQVTTVTLPEDNGSPQTKPNPMFINTKILLNQGTDRNEVPLYLHTPQGQGYIVDSHGRILHIAKGPFRRPVKFIRLKKIHDHALSQKQKQLMKRGTLQNLDNNGAALDRSNGLLALNKHFRLGKEQNKLSYTDSSNYKKDPGLQVNLDNVDDSMVINNLLSKDSLDTSGNGKNVILDVTNQLNKSFGRDKLKDSSGHIPMSFMKDLKNLKDMYNPEKLIVNIAQNTNFEKMKK